MSMLPSVSIIGETKSFPGFSVEMAEGGEGENHEI